MKKAFVLLFFLFTYFINAQNAQDIIDGLKRDLKTNPDAKKTATIYSDLTWYYSNISLDSAMVYGKKAIESSIVLKDSTLLSQVYSDVGAVYFRNSEYIKSKENYLKAYQIRKDTKDNAGLAKINANLANIYLNTKEFDKAMKFFLAALKYFEEKEDLNNANVIKANIGQLFTNLRDYPNAIKYLNQAIEYSEKSNLKDRLCEQYLNIAISYLSSNNLVQAELFYKKSIVNCSLVSNKKGLAIDYQGLAIINSKKNNDSISSLNLKIAENLKNQVNSKIDKANLRLTIVRNLIKNKEFNKSKIILLEVKKIFKTQKSDEDLLNTYKYLIPVCAQINQPDSVSFYVEKYTNLNEKLITNSVIKQTTELETKYQTAKKEKQIIQHQAEAKQKNTYLVGLSVFALLIGLVGFLIYKQQTQKNQQQAQEHQLKNAIAQIETQNKLQEQRLSISRDLHDNIGAQLTFIISSVDNVKYGFEINNPKLDNKLTNISSFAKDTIVELRDTIWAMNSNEISYEDLEIRINNYIEKAKLSKDQISFSFAIDDKLKTKKLTSVEGMNIYRTIQEAINNSIKYANASIITVNVKLVDDQTHLTITDNGSGFDITTTETGNGLQNMKKRIEEIGGKFSLISGDNGTRIEVII